MAVPSLCEVLHLPPSVMRLFFQPDLHVGSQRDDPMRRRNLLFGLLAVATLRSARGQQNGKVHRIAFVDPATSSRAELTQRSGNPFVKAFFDELRRLGYVEGQNLLIEGYSGESN